MSLNMPWFAGLKVENGGPWAKEAEDRGHRRTPCEVPSSGSGTAPWILGTLWNSNGTGSNSPLEDHWVP